MRLATRFATPMASKLPMTFAGTLPRFPPEPSWWLWLQAIQPATTEVMPWPTLRRYHCARLWECEKSMNKNKKYSRQRGFTLIELLMVVLLLSIVVGAVFSQIDRAQVRYRVEDQRVDLTQQEREFIDQFTRDLHQAGYPSAAMYGGIGTTNQIALGLISLSSNDIVIEGDVDGDGAVDTVEYSYFDGSGWPAG